MLHRLVRVDRDADGNAVLEIPRRDTALVRFVARTFRLTPHRRVALDGLGTFVIELCDGSHTIREIADRLGERYRLSRREAELATSEFLRTLGRRSIVGLVIEESPFEP